MEKIFAKSEEKYVQSVIVFGASGILYLDEETTTKVDPSDVKNLFIKNCLVVYDLDIDKFVRPVSMALDDDGVPTNVDAIHVESDLPEDTVTPIRYTFE